MTTDIMLNIQAPGEPIVPFWKKLTTAGRAAEGLREDWREHLREVQREIGFEYIRFHGLFHDDMMIYHEDANGRPYYNWQYLDSLMDFLRSVGLRPLMELSFTPSKLKTGEETIFWWKGNITPPADYSKWAGLVREMIVHSIDRYGLEEVLRWYFEVWNEPNLHNLFWSSDQPEYFKLYRVTAETIKAIYPGLRVGGPATSGFSEGEAPWVKDFINFCHNEQVPVDFITTHPYPNSWPLDSEGVQIMGYRGPDSTLEDLTWLRNTVDNSPLKDLEIHLTEWSCSPSPRDLVHDTAFMAPFLLHHNIRCLGLVDSLGFWVFTDVFEENGAGDTLFHGGFGLINGQGLKKASYYGYWFLSRLGNEKVAVGPDYIVTRKGEDVQILLWNYCHYTQTLADGDRSALQPLDRYSAFEGHPRAFRVALGGLEGSYKVIEHLLDCDNGSAYDAWLRNGALESPTEEELAILKKQTGPVSTIARLEGQAAYLREVTLAPHGVLLIELKKRYQ